MKEMKYKEEDGTQYKISFSEELQLKNLRAAKDNAEWSRRNFYAKVVLIAVLLALTVSFIYVLYRLDTIDFFTRILAR